MTTATFKAEKFAEVARKLIRWQAKRNLSNMLKKLHPADISLLLMALSPHEQDVILEIIKKQETIAEVISHLDSGTQLEIFKRMSPEKISEILAAMPSDDAADILRTMPEEMAGNLMGLMKSPETESLTNLLQYEEDTAGAIMTPHFFALPETATAQLAVDKLREIAGELEMVFYLYVVDDRQHLVGVISLRQLLTVPPQTSLAEIMNRDVISVTTDMDQEDVAHLVSRYDILAIPVVDHQGKLVGIITVDDIIDVIRQEATEDIYRMAGTKDEEILFSHSVTRVAKIRMPWLLTNLIGGLISGSLIWLFKLTLRDALVLVTFIPVITGMGGNVGTQSSSITVRGIATGRVNPLDAWYHIFREMRIGLILGLACGSLVALIAILWHGKPALGIIVGVAMFIAMTVAASSGVMMPIVFRRLNIDPAIASGPFVTTFNDITGILIYFGLATSLIYFLK